MKKAFFLFALLFPWLCQAQLNTKEKGFNIDLGVGANLSQIFNNVHPNSGNLAFANLFHLNVKYKDGVLGYGLRFDRLNFVTDEDSAVVFKDAVASILQYNTNVNLYEGKKIGIYLGAGIGVNGLNYQQRDSSGVYGKVKMSGFSGSLFLGMNYHFAGKFGVFVQAGFMSNTNNLTEFSVNGNQIEEFANREVSDVIFTMRGFDFKTGIRFAF